MYSLFSLTSFKSNDKHLGTLEQSLKLYQCLSLQNLLHNSVFANVFNLGYIMVLSLSFMILAVCAVRLSSLLDPSIYITFPLSFFMCFSQVNDISTLLSQIYEKSVQLLSVTFLKSVNMEQVGLRPGKIVLMRIKSSIPLKFWIGKLYFIKQSTKLTLLAFLINSTVYLLLL